MKALKKILGLVWVVIGPIAMTFLLLQAIEKVGLAHTEIERTNTLLQWSIILLIFLPISLGLMIFGVYAIKGEYTHLPDNSEEI
ncbi:DUF6814 family protein [Pedobacter sp. MW01-1-1]|uniref:DUF6814 family protein n=1 Tax=Pedobacter sp. MW01-1-1 TaxID=3383027 RepID=UPI003FEFF765